LINRKLFRTKFKYNIVNINYYYIKLKDFGNNYLKKVYED